MTCRFCPELTKHNIFVDFFRASKTVYSPNSIFCLTHVHADHVQGLGRRWKRANGLIYCSKVTRALVQCTFDYLTDDMFFVMDDAKPYTVHRDVDVRAFPSYHCDGSRMFCFLIRHFGVVLITSDFRIHHLESVWPRDLVADHVYYDDTLSNVTVDMPSQLDTYKNLVWAIAKVRERLGPTTRLCINVNVLGFEPVLRKMITEQKETLRLSLGIQNSKRARELYCLLQSTLLCDPEETRHQGSEDFLPAIELCDRRVDKKEDDKVWIYPSATYFFCSRNRRFLPVKLDLDARVVRLFFSSHAGYREIQELERITRAKNMIPCGTRMDVYSLKC